MEVLGVVPETEVVVEEAEVLLLLLDLDMDPSEHGDHEVGIYGEEEGVHDLVLLVLDRASSVLALDSADAVR